MSYAYPSIDDFKKFFFREFNFEPERKTIFVEPIATAYSTANGPIITDIDDTDDEEGQDGGATVVEGEEDMGDPLEFDSKEDFVVDDDVIRAFILTNVKINPKLFWNQDEFTVGYLYLAAFFLASESVIGKQTLKLENSKSLAESSISFTIPEEVAKSAHYSWLASNRFGIIYYQLIRGKTLGTILTIPGATTTL